MSFVKPIYQHIWCFAIVLLRYFSEDGNRNLIEPSCIASSPVAKALATCFMQADGYASYGIG
eukprot:1519309-Amphidinium_carterae.1